jgi:hypothetical protein
VGTTAVLLHLRWDHFEEDAGLNPPRKDPKRWYALQMPSHRLHDRTGLLVHSVGLGASRRRHLWPLWSGGRELASRHPAGLYEKLSGRPANKVKPLGCLPYLIKVQVVFVGIRRLYQLGL